MANFKRSKKLTRKAKKGKKIRKVVKRNGADKKVKQIRTIWRNPLFDEFRAENLNEDETSPSNINTTSLDSTAPDQQKAFLAIHNHMVMLGVNFQRDVLKLQEHYQDKFYGPLQKLQGSLLKAVNYPDKNFSFGEIDDKIRSTTICSDDKIYKKLKDHCELLVSAGTTNSNDDFYKNFWKKVLVSSNHIISRIIQAKDLEILNYLAEITTNTLNERNPRDKVKKNGFQIEFKFLTNPYFHNKKIVKRYLIDIYPDELRESCNDEDKDFQDLMFDKDVCLDYQGPKLREIRSTRIAWKAREKKLRNKNKDAKEEKSFVSFFDYIQSKWNGSSDEDQEKIELDFEIGSYISGVMIPNAFSIVRKEQDDISVVDEKQEVLKTNCSFPSSSFKKAKFNEKDVKFYQEFCEMWKSMNTFRNSTTFSDILKRLELPSLELQEKDSKTIGKCESSFSQHTDKEYNNKNTRRSKSDIRNYLKASKNKTTNCLPPKISQSENNEALLSIATNKIAAEQEFKKLFEELSKTGEDLSTDIGEKLSDIESEKVEPCESDLKVGIPTPYHSTASSNNDLHKIERDFFNVTPFQSAGFCLQQLTNFDENFDTKKHGDIFEKTLTVSSRDSIQDLNQFENELDKRNHKITDRINTKEEIEKIIADSETGNTVSGLGEVVSSSLVRDDRLLSQQTDLESQSCSDSGRSNLKTRVAKKRKSLVKQRCLPYNKRLIYSTRTSLTNQSLKNQKTFCIKKKTDNEYRVSDGDNIQVDDETEKEDKDKVDEQLDDKEKVEDIPKKDSFHVSTRYQYPGIFVQVVVPQLVADDKEEIQCTDSIKKELADAYESSVCSDKNYFADLKEMLMNLTPEYIERRRLEDCISEDEEYKTAEGTPLSSQFYDEIVSNLQTNNLILLSSTRKSLKRKLSNFGDETTEGLLKRKKQFE